MRTNKLVPRTKQNLFSESIMAAILFMMILIGLSGCASKKIYCQYENYGNERVWACEKR